MTRGWLVAGALGLVVGALSQRGSPRPAVDVAPAEPCPVAPPPRAPPPAACDVASRERWIDYLDDQLQRQLEATQGPDADGELAEGEPVPWPEGLDAAEEERQAVAWFEARLPDYASILEVACEEPPCILAIRMALNEAQEAAMWERDPFEPDPDLPNGMAAAYRAERGLGGGGYHRRGDLWVLKLGQGEPGTAARVDLRAKAVRLHHTDGPPWY